MSEASPQRGNTQDRNAVRVLVVDDDPTNRIVARAILGRFGCAVEFAENGEDAVRMVAEGDYDLVFMDCMMPVMDGFHATQAIRANELRGRNSHTPIIALTALCRPEDRQHCLDVGMDDFISKPARAEVFRQVIDRWKQPDRCPRD
ncbi:MAG: response regulator [Planctomycetota bacterium]